MELIRRPVLQDSFISRLAAILPSIKDGFTRAEEKVFETMPLGVEDYGYGYPLVTQP